jgi:hypothetical protein
VCRDELLNFGTGNLDFSFNINSTCFYYCILLHIYVRVLHMDDVLCCKSFSYFACPISYAHFRVTSWCFLLLQSMILYSYPSRNTIYIIGIYKCIGICNVTCDVLDVSLPITRSNAECNKWKKNVHFSR